VETSLGFEGLGNRWDAVLFPRDQGGALGGGRLLVCSGGVGIIDVGMGVEMFGEIGMNIDVSSHST
jgi:hypothetical protein